MGVFCVSSTTELNIMGCLRESVWVQRSLWGFYGRILCNFALLQCQHNSNYQIDVWQQGYITQRLTVHNNEMTGWDNLRNFIPTEASSLKRNTRQNTVIALHSTAHYERIILIDEKNITRHWLPCWVVGSSLSPGLGDHAAMMRHQIRWNSIQSVGHLAIIRLGA